MKRTDDSLISYIAMSGASSVMLDAHLAKSIENTGGASCWIASGAAPSVPETVGIMQIMGESPGFEYLISDLYLPSTSVPSPNHPRQDPEYLKVFETLNADEAVFRLQFVNTSAVVNGLYLYSNSAMPTGLTLKFGCSSGYYTPTNSTSTIATSVVPTGAPASPNISVRGSFATITADTFKSDYVYLQLSTTSLATPGGYTVPLVVRYLQNGWPFFLYLTCHITVSSSGSTIKVDGTYGNTPVDGLQTAPSIEGMYKNMGLNGKYGGKLNGNT